jgi:hypothetical protein
MPTTSDKNRDVENAESISLKKIEQSYRYNHCRQLTVTPASK